LRKKDEKLFFGGKTTVNSSKKKNPVPETQIALFGFFLSHQP
jgi:hypothetical protein